MKILPSRKGLIKIAQQINYIIRGSQNASQKYDDITMQERAYEKSAKKIEKFITGWPKCRPEV